jgi:hypothetical protein
MFQKRWLVVHWSGLFTLLMGTVLLGFSVASLAGVTELKAKLLLAGITARQEGYEVIYLNVGRLNQGDTDTYSGTCYASTPYVLLAVGESGNMDVDLHVVDENRNKICEDSESSDVAVCDFTPHWTGPFAALVKMYRGSGLYGYMVMLRPY